MPLTFNPFRGCSFTSFVAQIMPRSSKSEKEEDNLVSRAGSGSLVPVFAGLASVVGMSIVCGHLTTTSIPQTVARQILRAEEDVADDSEKGQGTNADSLTLEDVEKMKEFVEKKIQEAVKDKKVRWIVILE